MPTTRPSNRNPSSVRGPPGAHRLDPHATPDVPQRDDRHEDVVERPEDRDELGDQVDGRDDPGEEPDEHEPDIERGRRVADDVPEHPNEVGNDADQLACRDSLGTQQPEQREQDGPQDEDADDDPDDDTKVHERRVTWRTAVGSFGRNLRPPCNVSRRRAGPGMDAEDPEWVGRQRSAAPLSEVPHGRAGELERIA